MSGFGFNEIFGNIFATTRIESNWDLAKRWGRIASVGYQVYNSPIPQIATYILNKSSSPSFIAAGCIAVGTYYTLDYLGHNGPIHKVLDVGKKLLSYTSNFLVAKTVWNLVPQSYKTKETILGAAIISSVSYAWGRWHQEEISPTLRRDVLAAMKQNKEKYTRLESQVSTLEAEKHAAIHEAALTQGQLAQIMQQIQLAQQQAAAGVGVGAGVEGAGVDAGAGVGARAGVGGAGALRP